MSNTASLLASYLEGCQLRVVQLLQLDVEALHTLQCDRQVTGGELDAANRHT
jgi:hypothetical protein